ncbi:SRPBCC family protein [Brucella intermedia]|uniref:SRPBCC family protein n=1 Tax=Brucella intermedia TaxID=94625 RepID=UPI00224A5C75|nr:SRPBCC family protein [Brucella intermedia]
MKSATGMIVASRNEIFQYLEDCSTWTLWHTDLAGCVLPHGVTYGSKGWLLTSGGRRRFTVTHVDYPNSLSLALKFPFASIILDGRLRQTRDMTETIIRARFEGPLAIVYRASAHERLQRLVDQTLENLTKAAETGLFDSILEE